DDSVDLCRAAFAHPPDFDDLALALGGSTPIMILAEQSIGFSASARTLARAGMNTEMLRYFSAAHEAAHLGWYAAEGVVLHTVLVSMDELPPASLAAQAVVELVRVLSKLAEAERSRSGLPSDPPPAMPPGQVVWTHPLVPRGPDAPLSTATSWPSGGVLSVA